MFKVPLAIRSTVAELLLSRYVYFCFAGKSRFMHLLFSSAPAMASTMKLFILLLICYVAFGFEQMPYWQIEEEMETVNVSLPVVLVPVPMDPDRHYAYTRSTVESTTTSPAMPVVSTVTTTTTTTKPPVRCCSSTRAPSSSTRTTTRRTTAAASVPTTTTATTTTVQQHLLRLCSWRHPQ